MQGVPAAGSGACDASLPCCWQVICGKCSSKRAPLAYLDNRKERVCMECYAVIQPRLPVVCNVLPRRKAPVVLQVSRLSIYFHLCPRDAMLARVLAMALCLSVCLSVTSRCSTKSDEWINLVLTWMLLLTSPTLCFKEFHISTKRVLPSGTFRKLQT